MALLFDVEHCVSAPVIAFSMLDSAVFRVEGLCDSRIIEMALRDSVYHISEKKFPTPFLIGNGLTIPIKAFHLFSSHPFRT
jgi:hypothetical protein